MSQLKRFSMLALAMIMASCTSQREFTNAVYFKNSCLHNVHAIATNDSNYDAININTSILPGRSALVASYLSVQSSITDSLDGKYTLTLDNGVTQKTLTSSDVRKLLKNKKMATEASLNKWIITDSSICQQPSSNTTSKHNFLKG